MRGRWVQGRTDTTITMIRGFNIDEDFDEDFDEDLPGKISTDEGDEDYFNDEEN